MTRAEIERFSGAGHLMQKYLRSIAAGDLWYLTTAKGVSRETVANIQKRIHRLQHERDFYKYSAWCFETRPKLHAHFLFVGDTAVVERLGRGTFGETITIKPVYDLPGLVKGYQAKERTPQAGYGRERQLGGRIPGVFHWSQRPWKPFAKCSALSTSPLRLRAARRSCATLTTSSRPLSMPALWMMPTRDPR